MNQRQSSQTTPIQHELQVVYSRFLRSENYSPAIFMGFSSLRVLTYSASISMIIQMLSQFDSVECIFGYEGVIPQLSTVLAYQQFVCEQLATIIIPRDAQRDDSREAVKKRTQTKEGKALSKRQKCVSLEG